MSRLPSPRRPRTADLQAAGFFLAVPSDVAYAVPDEGHASLLDVVRTISPSSPGLTVFPLLIEKFNPHVVDKQVIISLPALGCDYPCFLGGVFIVNRASKNRRYEFTLVFR